MLIAKISFSYRKKYETLSIYVIDSHMKIVTMQMQCGVGFTGEFMFVYFSLHLDIVSLNFYTLIVRLRC